MRMRKVLMLITLCIVLKSIQKFDSHVKFFLIVVSFKPFWLFVKKPEIRNAKQAEELTCYCH